MNDNQKVAAGGNVWGFIIMCAALIGFGFCAYREFQVPNNTVTRIKSQSTPRRARRVGAGSSSTPKHVFQDNNRLLGPPPYRYVGPPQDMMLYPEMKKANLAKQVRGARSRSRTGAATRPIARRTATTRPKRLPR